MSFEKFVLPGRGASPRVSVNSNGQFVFNRGTFKKLELSRYNAVIFFWDDTERKVGIKFSDDAKEEGACRLYVRKDNFAVVSGTAFVSYFGIKNEVVGRYDFEFDEKEKMIIIDTKKKL
jgi:hypothetical protein